MTRREFLLRSGLILGAFVPLSPPELSVAAEARGHLVVVVQTQSAVTELSLRDLKRLYFGERVTDPRGERLVPLNHPQGAALRVAFDRLVLKMDPDAVGRYWIDRKIRGQSPAPKSVASEDLLRRAVAALPGTVGYLWSEQVTPDLKVVSIDGRRPTDAEYPLK